MKKLLLAMMLSSTVSFGMSLNTEILVEFPQETEMILRVDLHTKTIGETNKETILDQNFELKKQPSYNDIETLKTSFDSILIVGTFLKVIEELLVSSQEKDLDAFKISEIPMKVLLTRPLLPIYFGFLRNFDETYIIKKDENEDWLAPINEMEKLNNEWDEQIRNLHLHK